MAGFESAAGSGTGSGAGGAAVVVPDPREGAHRVEIADFSRLLSERLDLGSEPRSAGLLEDTETLWITQRHPAGRLSFLDLDRARLRTLTGFRLRAAVTSTEDGQ